VCCVNRTTFKIEAYCRGNAVQRTVTAIDKREVSQKSKIRSLHAHWTRDFVTRPAATQAVIISQRFKLSRRRLNNFSLGKRGMGRVQRRPLL